MTFVKNVFDEINRNECFGYSPSSNSTKPAHIANGWFKYVLGRRYDPVLLNQTVVHWTKMGEINPSDKLIAENAGIFQRFQAQSSRNEFAEFREDLKLLVSPFGGAVNKGNRFSSYNITCDRHITEDTSDGGAGAFLYHLVSTDLGGGPSPTIDLLREILKQAKDEVSAITYPLTANAPETPINLGNYSADDVFRKRGKSFVSLTLTNLRMGFDNLSKHEVVYGGGLDAMRKLVAFGVFGILLHMQNRRGEFLKLSALNPMFVYFDTRQRSTAYQASHATYNLNRRSIETLYTQQLMAWLEPRVGRAPTPKKCEEFIKHLEFVKGDDKENKKPRETLMRYFRSFSGQLGNLESMAEAVREAHFRELNATPLDFYRAIGIRVGAIRPVGTNAIRKYYAMEGVLLEAILSSVLPDGEMTYRQFLCELYDRYGILVGGRSEDSGILMQAGIGNATVEDLQANSHVFRQQLLSLGWARQYADGVLVVQVPEGLR